MTLGHRTNAIHQGVVSSALDLKIDMLARVGERLVDPELVRAVRGDDPVRLRLLSAAAEHCNLGAVPAP